MAAKSAEYSVAEAAESRVFRIVLTGGPCAGKTTALARITERLGDHGFNVYRVPEAATLLQSGGLSFAGLRQEQVIDMQAHLMRVQAALEDEFDGVARSSSRYSKRPSVLLCDRGLMDGRAYVTAEMFNEVVVAARVDPWVEAAIEGVLPGLERDSAAADAAADASGVSRMRRSASDDTIAGGAGHARSSSSDAASTDVLAAATSTRAPVPQPTASLLPSLTPHAGPEADRRLALRQRLLAHPRVRSAVREAQSRMRDERYDVVLHLVTAADGAAEHYTTDNNATRSETTEQAVAVDLAIRNAWLGAPAHRIVGNGIGGFEGKMDRAVAALSAKMGVPLPGATKRFWVLRCSGMDEWRPPAGTVVRDFVVVHTYLRPTAAGKWVTHAEADETSVGGLRDSVRLTLRRALGEEDEAGTSAEGGRASSPSVATDEAGIPLGSDGVPLTVVPSGLNSGEFSLQLRAARRIAGTPRPVMESQRMLTTREYSALMASRDPARAAVAKRRRVLVHGSRAFELDELTSPPQYRGLCILSTEVEAGVDVELPPGIAAEEAAADGRIVACDVTGDTRFLTSSFSSGDGPDEAEWGVRA